MRSRLSLTKIITLLGLGLVGYLLFNPSLWFPEKGIREVAKEQKTRSEKPVYEYSIDLAGRTPQGLSLFDNKLYVSYRNLNMVDILDYKGKRHNMFVPYPQGRVSLVMMTHDQSGNLYLVDSLNRVILAFDTNNKFLGPFPPRKISPAAEDYLSFPFSISINNNLNFVSDLGNGTVKAFLSNGDFIQDISGTGADNSLQWHPVNVAQTNDGRLLVSDIRNRNISVFSCSGRFAYFFEQHEEVGSDFLPGAIAIDGASRVHVADDSKGRIVVFDNFGRFLFTYGKRPQKTWLSSMGPMNIVINETEHLIFIADKAEQEIEVWGYTTPTG